MLGIILFYFALFYTVLLSMLPNSIIYLAVLLGFCLEIM